MAITNEQKRQQSGRDMGEVGRASGRKMRDDMRALAENNRLERTLPALPVRGKQPAKRGSAVWQDGAPPSGGGGVSGPLTERPEARRRYGEAVVIPGGGFFAYLVQPVRQMTFDSPDGELVVNFGLPDYMNPDYEVEL